MDKKELMDSLEEILREEGSEARTEKKTVKGIKKFFSDKKKRTAIIASLMVLTVIILMLTDFILENRNQYTEAKKIVAPFAKEHNISIEDYPDELLSLLEKNPETEEFVKNYPLRKGLHTDFSLEEYKTSAEIPHLMQWDMRWGYEEYAGSLMGISGCGPTCLSMIAIYLTKDTSLDPLYIARFAEENGYAVKNNGTQWTLMSEGAEKLGLVSEELPLDKGIMTDALSEGKPIILIMGEGDFTTSGHFIVLTSCDEEGFSVLDPNSRARSSQKWTYERIEGQIRNIWCFSSD